MKSSLKKADNESERQILVENRLKKGANLMEVQANKTNIENPLSIVQENSPKEFKKEITGMYSLIFGSFSAKRSLDANVDSEGLVNVKTADNFKIKFSGKREEWAITSPDGRETRIWGDPHVVESDGDKWDFYENSTFVFGDNKVTVETKKLPNGTSYSQTVTIYGKHDRFTLTGIDVNKPELKAWSLDGFQHDKSLADGDIYHLQLDIDGTDTWKKL